MSDVKVNSATEHVYLLPNELLVEDRFDIRRDLVVSEAAKAKEDEELALMGQSLAEKQWDDLLGVRTEKGVVVVAGHRRRAAALIENQSRSANAQPLIRLRVRLLDPNSDLMQACIQSNTIRKNLTAGQMAKLCERIMKENGWANYAGQKKAAKYIGVSVATVIQMMKFLTAPRAIQEALAVDQISADSGLKMLADLAAQGLQGEQAEESVREVLTSAREVQVAQAKQKAAKEVEQGKKTEDKAREDVKKAEEGKIEAPAISKAIRKQQDEAAEQGARKAVARTMKDVKEWAESLDGPAYNHPDSAVRVWAGKFLSWALGELSDGAMQKAFDRMVEGSDPGTKEASEKERLKEEREAQKAEREAQKKEKEREKAKEEKRKERERAKEAERAKKEEEKQKVLKEKQEQKEAEKRAKDEEKRAKQAEKDAAKKAKEDEKKKKEEERVRAADEKLKKKLEELEEKRQKLQQGKEGKEDKEGKEEKEGKAAPSPKKKGKK